MHKAGKDIKFTKFVIITPVKDEEAFIEKTVLSMISQTVRPNKWIIVNDGSIDKTGEIVQKYAGEHDWIEMINRPPGRAREPGRAVIESFYDGYDSMKNLEFDFIVKLDGDLSFEPNYFEEIFKRFKRTSKLGIASGSCYVERGNRLILEKTPRSHTRGPTKVYKRECWNDIGGLVAKLGWDTIDEIKAQMRGWKTRSFNELKLVHHRPTGHAGGALKGRIKQGLGAYYLGYHPIFMLVRVVNRIPERPFLIGALAMWWGFLSGYLKGLEQFEDPKLRQYLRKKQLERLQFWKVGFKRS